VATGYDTRDTPIIWNRTISSLDKVTRVRNVHSPTDRLDRPPL